MSGSPPGTSETTPGPPQTPSKRTLKPPRASQVAPLRSPQDASRGPVTPPRRPQDAPKRPQHAPRTSPGLSVPRGFKLEAPPKRRFRPMEVRRIVLIPNPATRTNLEDCFPGSNFSKGTNECPGSDKKGRAVDRAQDRRSKPFGIGSAPRAAYKSFS